MKPTRTAGKRKWKRDHERWLMQNYGISGFHNASGRIAFRRFARSQAEKREWHLLSVRSYSYKQGILNRITGSYRRSISLFRIIHVQIVCIYGSSISVDVIRNTESGWQVLSSIGRCREHSVSHVFSVTFVSYVFALRVVARLQIPRISILEFQFKSFDIRHRLEKKNTETDRSRSTLLEKLLSPFDIIFLPIAPRRIPAHAVWS